MTEALVAMVVAVAIFAGAAYALSTWLEHRPQIINVYVTTAHP